MTKPELVLYKSSRIKGRLDRIRDGVGVGKNVFAAEPTRIEQVAFNMFLAMQECLDMSSHIVSDEGWGTPSTLAEMFDVLEKRGVLTPETAAAMRRGTRLRNLIAHAYGDLDPEKLFDAASSGILQIGRYLAEVGDWMARSSSSG